VGLAVLIWTVLKVGLKSLRANPLRSVLAVLGIIIGVAAVIAMLAIGSGAKKQVLDRFSAMGTNLLIVMPGQRGQHGVMTGTQQNLTLEDAQAIAAEVPEVRLVSPGVSGSAQLKYLNRNTRSSVYGTSATYFSIRDIVVQRGRIFSDAEAERLTRVAVLGPTAAGNLFGQDDPVGERIKINGQGFTILGVTKAKGEGWGSPDDRVIIPWSTAMKQVFGVESLREINIQVADEERLAQVQQEVATLLRRRHRIPGDLPDDFTIANMADIRNSAAEVTGIFRSLLGGIAAVSLLVGGIGIMNIMLVTVTERTREIGVRKAIGAREVHILMQFLVESVIISGLGGILGTGLGVLIARLVPRFSPLTTVVESAAVVLALTVSAGVGIFFGFYPAWRAARLDPVDALRYE
jgi:putative ABC transport system permease protein